jgi:hypothetical protein
MLVLRLTLVFWFTLVLRLTFCVWLGARLALWLCTLLRLAAEPPLSWTCDWRTDEPELARLPPLLLPLARAPPLGRPA